MAPDSDENVNRTLRCGPTNKNSVTLDLWSTVNCDTGQRWKRQLTDMGHGYSITKTIQNGSHVKGFEPKQTAVFDVDKVVIAYAFLGLLALNQVQDQFPLVGHTRLGFYDPEHVFPNHLDFFQ